RAQLRAGRHAARHRSRRGEGARLSRRARAARHPARPVRGVVIMSCEQLKSSFPEYWDGTLPLEERRALEAHFASCESCRLEARELGDAWQALDALPEEEPSPMLRQRFDAMLEGWQVRELPVRPPRARATSDRSRWWQSPFVWSTGALAAAALLLTVG